MKKGNLEKSFETLKGKYGLGANFIVSSKWVEVYDEDTFEYLFEMLKEFMKDENNNTDEYDLKHFTDGEWFVEYSFQSREEDTITMQVSAGEYAEDLANQPEWLTVDIDLNKLIEGKSRLPIDFYANVIEGKRDAEKIEVRIQLLYDGTVEFLQEVGEIELSQYDDDENLDLIMEVLLEDYGIDSIIKNDKIIRI